MGTSGAPGAAVHDERLGVLRHLRIEVVEQHAERRFGLPRARIEGRAAGSTDGRQIADQRLDEIGAHGPLPSEGSRAEERDARCRKRNHVHPVASRKYPPANASAFGRSPSVSKATSRIAAASAPWNRAAARYGCPGGGRSLTRAPRGP